MQGLTIGRLAATVGVNLETIRYYERIGLLPPPPRTRSGHRVYDGEAVRRLVFVRRAREFGFGLTDVRAFLALRRGEADPCEEVREIAEQHLSALDAKIEDLQRIRRRLAVTVEKCRADTTPACPVLDMLDG